MATVVPPVESHWLALLPAPLAGEVEGREVTEVT